MLISLPTLLARSKRQKEALACFSVNSVWTMEAVASAVSHHKGRAALVIDEENLGVMPLEGVIAYALHAIHTAEGEMALAVRLAPVHERITRALVSGAPSIWLSRHHHTPEEEYRQLSRWAVDRAYLHGCSVIGESGLPTLPLNPEELVAEYGVSALVVNLSVMRNGEAVLDREIISATTKKARVPLIGMEPPVQSHQRALCGQEGVAGFFYPPETLNEPFGAGLRTGLRDRSQSDPAVYQNLGVRAAAEAARNHLSS